MYANKAHQLFSLFWLTVPAPTCNAPLSSNGVITVSWSYIHTGGLPLTNLSVVYRYEEGLVMSPIDIASVEVMKAMVSNLVAGRLYTFSISAENTIGSISIDCGPIRLETGKYTTVSCMGKPSLVLNC